MRVKKIKLCWKEEDGSIHEETLEIGKTYNNYDEDGQEYLETLEAAEILQ